MEAGSVWFWIDKLTYSKDCDSDCSDAPAGDQCSANVVYETDLYGGDLRDVPVDNWAECCDVCGQDPDCHAWCAAGRLGGGRGAHVADAVPPAGVRATNRKRMCSPGPGPPGCLCRRTYTNGGCWLKDGTGWTQEAREGLISGWW